MSVWMIEPKVLSIGTVLGGFWYFATRLVCDKLQLIPSSLLLSQLRKLLPLYIPSFIICKRFFLPILAFHCVSKLEIYVSERERVLLYIYAYATTVFALGYLLRVF